MELPLSIKTSEFIEQYRSKINAGLSSIDPRIFKHVVKIIVDALESRHTIFVAGNGGSSAIAEHFTCDHSKGTATNTTFAPKFVNLTSNVSLLTAYANDVGYEHALSEQLILHADKNDVLIVISSSGNSMNIINAINVARGLGLTTVALVGFDGGLVKSLADYCIHIPIDSYGIAEDCHQSVMHMLSHYIRTVYTNQDINTVRL